MVKRSSVFGVFGMVWVVLTLVAIAYATRLALVVAPTAWVILSRYQARIAVTTSPSTSVNR